MSYTINYATSETIQESDVITFQENVNIYIDNTSMFYLLGTQIDYIENHIRSEFTFSNPNAQGKYYTRFFLTEYSPNFTFFI